MGIRGLAIGVIHAVFCVTALGGCEELLADLLTPAQVQAIDGARNTHSIRVVQGTVDGVPRTVVIVGEGHLQTGSALTAGRALVDAFPARGYERFPGGITLRMFLRLAYLVEGLTTFRFGGSTLPYASRRRAGTETVNLERGYQPTDQELATAWGIPLSYLGLRFSWAPAAAGLWHAVSTGNIESWGTVAGLFGSTVMMGASVLGRAHLSDTAGGVLTRGRDPHMATRIHEFFAGDAGRRVMLVVVGDGHVNGIERHLRQQYGFQSLYATSRPRPENDDAVPP